MALKTYDQFIKAHQGKAVDKIPCRYTYEETEEPIPDNDIFE